jgi:hypothetical protein
MVIDDEPAELGSMLDALSRRFGADCSVVLHLPARAGRGLQDQAR